jgi:hypothetical protein
LPPKIGDDVAVDSDQTRDLDLNEVFSELGLLGVLHLVVVVQHQRLGQSGAGGFGEPEGAGCASGCAADGECVYQRACGSQRLLLQRNGEVVPYRVIITNLTALN